MTGLTTGAITTVLDRLESGRVRAPGARPARPPARARRDHAGGASGAADFYGEHIAESEQIYKRYTLEQIELLLEFVRGGRELNERDAARLEARTRGERAS